MNKKGQGDNKLVGIILLLMILLIGLALLVNIVNTKALSTDKQSIVNDSINIASGVTAGGINETFQHNVTKTQTGWRTTECPLTGITLTNSSGTGYTDTTDYVFTASLGNFTLKNTAKVNASVLSDNLTYVSYTYCDEGYFTSSGDRSLANLLPTLLVIVLLFVAAGFAYRWMNER